MVLLFTIVLMFLLTACEPASKSEIMRYASREYGRAEFIDKEVVDDDKVIYHLRDKAYGFEYSITSRMMNIGLDGAVLGKSEHKESDFFIEYYIFITEHLRDKLDELEETYNVEIIADSKTYSSVSYDYHIFAEIHYKDSDTQTAQTLSKKVNDLYKACDKRQFWQECKVDVYDQNEERIGGYDLRYNMWMTEELEEDYYYIEQAQVLNSDAVYVRKEEKLFKDTGLSLDAFTTRYGEEPLNEDTVVTYYYLTVEGKEFFITDIETLYPTKSLYSNYSKVMQSR